MAHPFLVSRHFLLCTSPQLFRLAIHDSVTQKLRLRASLLTKQPKRELTAIGAVDVGLADLRVRSVTAV